MKKDLTNKEKLQNLLKLLSRKESWIKKAFARTKTGRTCEPKSRKAVCWCLFGGCERVGITHPFGLFDGCLGKYNGIISFNDHKKTTHRNVLARIRAAIRKCKT